MASYRVWLYISILSTILLGLTWGYDIIRMRPYHIGPLQFRFILLASAIFITSLIILARELSEYLNEKAMVEIILEDMNHDMGFESGKPSVEGIITSFYLAHRNKKEWSLHTREGIRLLTYLKIYIKDRTGEELTIKEIHSAISRIDAHMKELRKKRKDGVRA